MITIEQLNAIRNEMAPKLAMRHGHGHFVDAGDGIRKTVLICGGTGCTSSSSMKVRDALVAELEANNIADEIKVVTTGCFGLCALGPIMIVYPEGTFYSMVTPNEIPEIVSEHLVKGNVVKKYLYKETVKGDEILALDQTPFYGKQKRVALRNCGVIDPECINEYIGSEGYQALAKVLTEMAPDDVIKTISDSGLRGRGGGGFPTGTKWKFACANRGEVKKYVVCNADEGDPGAFMDRSIMEGDPHRMLEGMMIAAVACGATEGYIYVRAEYPLAVFRLRTAIEQAKEIGLLGKNILGSGFDFDLHINQGAGAFVCGEGSALTASIEGKRGMPRTKPPRTVEHGLFEMPTVLNNVETYANVPSIISKGAKWFCTIGTESSPGTKAFAITGNIANTGLIEVPMGTTLREVVYTVGGGMRGEGQFKAVQIGGPSGGCLTEKDLDLPLDFDSLKKVGAMIGSGGLVVMNDKTCMVEVARFFMHFTQNESCGKCTPCREGTKRMLEILERIVHGKGEEGDIELLLELADTVSSTALCGLGKSAPNPVVSTIKNFRDEYEAHIFEKRCPTGNCARLKRIVIDPAVCKGCSKCARQCPAGAISGELKSPFHIDLTKCLRCGACITACPFHAIREE